MTYRPIPYPLSDGGTGATTAATALANLGGIGFTNPLTVSGNTTLLSTSSSQVIINGGPFTMTLPSVASSIGKIFAFSNQTNVYDANVVAAAGADTICSQANLILGGYGACTAFINTGVQWIYFGAPIANALNGNNAILYNLAAGIFAGTTAVANGQRSIWNGQPAWSNTVEGCITDSTSVTLGQYDLLNRLVNCASSPITYTLPDATTCSTKYFSFKKIDSSSNAITFLTVSSQTIDGGSSASLSGQNSVLDLYSNGVNWEITNYFSGAQLSFDPFMLMGA